MPDNMTILRILMLLGSITLLMALLIQWSVFVVVVVVVVVCLLFVAVLLFFFLGGGRGVCHETDGT